MINSLSAAIIAFMSVLSIEPDVGDTHIFYFHGRIVEDGLPAVSPQFGEYDFQAITDALRGEHITLHAKQRSANADIVTEAEEALVKIEQLVDQGVPYEKIALVGASKGSQIATLVSHELANPDVRLVVLAGCWPQMVEGMTAEGQFLFGDVLEIRDVEDRGLEPGCGPLVEVSDDVTSYKEIVTTLGVSHGLIYRPYPEWVDPTLEWVRPNSD